MATEREPKKKSASDRQVSIRIPGELLLRLQKVAKEEDRSIGYVIRVLLRDALAIRDQGGIGDHDHQAFIDG